MSKRSANELKEDTKDLKESVSNLEISKHRRLSFTNAPELICNLPPSCHLHPQSFHSDEEYEQHYVRYHEFVCSGCRHIFPSAFLMELHITESHDPFADLRRSRGEKIYRCFLPECEKLCSTPQKRRLHMIDKHHYPKDYLYSITKTGLRPGQTSLLKQHP